MDDRKISDLVHDIDAAILSLRQTDAVTALAGIERETTDWPWGFFTWGQNKRILERYFFVINERHLSGSKIDFCLLVCAMEFDRAKSVFQNLTIDRSDSYVRYLYVMACVSTTDDSAARDAALDALGACEAGSFVFERLVQAYEMACEGQDPGLALGLLDRFATSRNASPAMRVLSGIRHVQAGRADLANQDWMIAAQHAVSMLPPMRGIKTLVPFEGLDALNGVDWRAWHRQVSKLEFLTGDAADDSDFVFLASCDDKYFQQYGALWIAALDVSNPGGNVHVNIINPTDQTKGAVEGLKTKHKSIHLNFSFEKSHMATRSYYACSRFFIAPLVMERYARKLIITDLDIVVGGSGKDLSRALERHSVGMRVDQGWRLPWQKYIADFVCLNCDDPAGRFISLVNAFLAKAFVEKGDDIWWVDQAALFSVVSLLTSGAEPFDMFDPRDVTEDLIHYGGINFDGKLGWLAGTKLERMQAALADMTIKRG